MSAKRSPLGASSSLTDLAKPNTETTLDHQITQRKRKRDGCTCNCEKELQDLRRDITEMFKQFNITHETTMAFMRDNIEEMKSQLNNIKIATDSLNKEQMSMKTQISDLTNKATNADDKIQTLQSEIIAIKSNIATATPMPSFNENIIHELHERVDRERNIIIVGIPECRTNNADDSRAYDTNEVEKIINNLIEACPKPSKIFRLGKYNPTKNRNVKICFESSHTAKMLLRNKNKLQSGIRIFSDQTPVQQNYLKNLKNELAHRIANGENDITIKYVKGTPKITAINRSKN